MATRTLHYRTFCRRHAVPRPTPASRPPLPPRDPRSPSFGALGAVVGSVGCWALIVAAVLHGGVRAAVFGLWPLALTVVVAAAARFVVLGPPTIRHRPAT